MKQALIIIVIVLALAGAGFFGYKTFMGQSNSPITAVAGTSQILPYGDNLQFDSVKKYNKDGKTFQYPVVTPQEIGPDLNTVIK